MVLGTTEDRFLGGRVVLRQPRAGYRAATDPVLLAASLPARAGERVLDLGCGVGAAALCLAARVPGVRLAGLEIQPEYLALAAANAAANAAASGVALELHEGDVAAPPAALKAQVFDHVMMNPPWFGADAATPSPVPGRDLAHRVAPEGLAPWLSCGLARLKPGGWLAIVHRTEALPEILAGLGARAGAIRVTPLVARTGRDAARVIVRARKGARGPFRLGPALVLHAGASHVEDRDDFTPEAQAILRDAAALPL